MRRAARRLAVRGGAHAGRQLPAGVHDGWRPGPAGTRPQHVPRADGGRRLPDGPFCAAASQ
eukprot:4394233-Prymnesium_polylepis.1